MRTQGQINNTIITCTVATVTWSRVTVRVLARAQQESEARTEARSGEWGAVRPEYQLVTPSTHRNWICRETNVTFVNFT